MIGDRASDVTDKAHGAADAVNAKIMKSGVFEVFRIVKRATSGRSASVAGSSRDRAAL